MPANQRVGRDRDTTETFRRRVIQLRNVSTWHPFLRLCVSAVKRFDVALFHNQTFRRRALGREGFAFDSGQQRRASGTQQLAAAPGGTREAAEALGETEETRNSAGRGPGGDAQQRRGPAANGTAAGSRAEFVLHTG